MLFKMKNKMIDLNFQDFFHENPFKKTRGNIFKLVIPKCKTKFRKNFFTSSIVHHWNNMKSKDINVRSIYLFKRNVMKYLNKENIW